jgi:small-conductance mechanosensitive channel
MRIDEKEFNARLEKEGIEIPFNQIDVHVKNK